MAEKVSLNRRKKELIWLFITSIVVIMLFNRIIFTTIAIIHERLMISRQQRINNQETRFRTAEKAFEQKSYASALRQYQDFLVLYPESGFSETARYKIAESFRFIKNNEKAVEGYYLFAGKYPDSRLANTAILHIVDIYRDALENKMQKHNMRFRMAERAFDRKEFTASLRLYRKCLERDPEGAVAQTALYKIAESHRLLRNNLKALVTYHCFVQRYPDSPLTSSAMLHIAELYRFKKMGPEAIDTYAAFIKKYPADSNAPSATYWIKELKNTRK